LKDVSGSISHGWVLLLQIRLLSGRLVLSICAAELELPTFGKADVDVVPSKIQSVVSIEPEGQFAELFKRIRIQ
jgi:hypothetical protein